MNVKFDNKRNLGTRSTRSTVFGIALRTAGILAIPMSFAGIISIVAFYNGGTTWAPAYIAGLLLASAFVPWGNQLNVTGRRQLSRVLHDSEQLRGEPFVLYLRAFDNDSVLGKPELRFWNSITTPYNAQMLFDSALTDEEQIVKALAPAGLVVAIGRPGESLPRVGALRMYPTEDSWQEVVLDLMERAQLVVLDAGVGRSLTWELFQTMQRVHPYRLVILVSQGKGQYEDFRKSVDTYFDSVARKGYQQAGRKFKPIIFSRLPDFPSRENLDYDGPFHAWLICFDRNWVAERITLPSQFLQRNRIYKALSAGMKPVFQRISEAEACGDRKLLLGKERRI